MDKMDDLIERLRERIRRSPAVEMDAFWGRCTEEGVPLPTRPPNPPLPERAVEEFEAEYGFRLPTQVRRLYTEVADGGYGPAWGFYPLRQPRNADLDPEEDEPESIEGWLLQDRKERESGLSPEYWRYWPEPSISICNGGGGILVCVDCTSDQGRVFVDDPNLGCDGRTRLVPFADSVAEWLSKWLEQPWPEQTYP
jgi:hypothetical protein